MAFRTRDRKADRSEVELLRGLVTLANQLQSSLELDTIVSVIVSAVGKTFGFREAAVYLVEPDGETFRVHATLGQHPDYDAVLFERPVPRRVLDELFVAKYQIGTSYYVDARRHEWTDEQEYYFPPLDLGPRRDDEWRSGDDLFVPLYDQRRELMGVLDLFDPEDREPPALSLVKSLEVFATHAAEAIENARHYEELQAATAQLGQQLGLRHGLIELSEALLITLDQRELFGRIAALLGDFVAYDAMEIRLVDEEAGELYCGFASDSEAEQMKSWRAPLDVGVSGWVLTHNEAQLVNDMLGDPRGALVPGTDWEPQASIIAPLTVAGTVIGVLAVGPHGRAHLRRIGTRTDQALRQHGRHRHPERAPVRGGRGRVAGAGAPAGAAARLLDLSTALLGTLGRDTVFRRSTTMLKDDGRLRRRGHPPARRRARELVCIYARGVDAESCAGLPRLRWTRA